MEIEQCGGLKTKLLQVVIFSKYEIKSLENMLERYPASTMSENKGGDRSKED